MSIWEFANPVRFMRLSGRLLPYLVVLTVVSLVTGLIWGFFFTPDDRAQGAAVKILFVHVPFAFLAINIYFMMFVTSLIWLIRRHHVSALAAKAAAPIGAVFTLAAIISGALWGSTTWGTYWQWDPKLTSFLIMLIFYIGYIALWDSIDEPDKAADLTSILCLIGSVFAIVSRYAVNIWNQGIHQGASLSIDREEHVSNVYWLPLMLIMVGAFLLFLVLLLLRTRTEIRKRRITALQAREL
ncbi:MAG: cytochrome c biogenesis protein CcsA [Rhodobacteraceae bacterium]|nr:cytochrome c biogenesis protein CcsA [Paracoccaceae bacterium]